MGEFEVIRRFFQRPLRRKDVVTGPGDDCALLRVPADNLLAVSTDTLVAGVHFFADMDPVRLGHKALAVNLSDLAAMGGQALTQPCFRCRIERAAPQRTADGAKNIGTRAHRRPRCFA